MHKGGKYGGKSRDRHDNDVGKSGNSRDKQGGKGCELHREQAPGDDRSKATAPPQLLQQWRTSATLASSSFPGGPKAQLTASKPTPRQPRQPSSSPPRPASKSKAQSSMPIERRERRDSRHSRAERDFSEGRRRGRRGGHHRDRRESRSRSRNGRASEKNNADLISSITEIIRVATRQI